MSDLLRILQAEVETRTAATVASQPNWPCRKGCDDCCRSLAAVPLISGSEWVLLARHLQSLPAPSRQAIQERILQAASQEAAPFICPMLDRSSGACLVYSARPIACRSYGFYVEREKVLGCARIQSISQSEMPVLWGNHLALEHRLDELGNRHPLHYWLRHHPVPPARPTADSDC